MSQATNGHACLPWPCLPKLEIYHILNSDHVLGIKLCATSALILGIWDEEVSVVSFLFLMLNGTLF